MKFLFSFLLVILGILPTLAQNPQVKSVGEVRKIMYDADLSAKIRLDTLAHENLFAIGVMDSLRGEIVIANGKPLISSIKNTYVKTDTTFNHEATLLVYAYVKNWKEITIEQDLNNTEELEALVKRLASEHGIDVSRPFPFMIKAWVKNINYHVIDWQPGISHTAETHKQFAHDLYHSATTVMLAGFYSENHKGIFTPFDSKMLVHAVTSNPITCGHLESIETFGKMAIYFPDSNGTSKSIAVEAIKLEEY
jgi:acetolactate decarboxylase